MILDFDLEIKYFRTLSEIIFSHLFVTFLSHFVVAIVKDWLAYYPQSWYLHWLCFPLGSEPNFCPSFSRLQGTFQTAQVATSISFRSHQGPPSTFLCTFRHKFAVYDKALDEIMACFYCWNSRNPGLDAYCLCLAQFWGTQNFFLTCETVEAHFGIWFQTFCPVYHRDLPLEAEGFLDVSHQQSLLAI